MQAAATRCWSRWRMAARRGCAGACAPGARTRSVCMRGTWGTRCWATRRTAARPAALSPRSRGGSLSGEGLRCMQSLCRLPPLCAMRSCMSCGVMLWTPAIPLVSVAVPCCILFATLEYAKRACDGQHPDRMRRLWRRVHSPRSSSGRCAHGDTWASFTWAGKGKMSESIASLSRRGLQAGGGGARTRSAAAAGAARADAGL